MKIRWLLTAVPISLFLTLSAGGLRMQTVPPSGKAAVSIAKPAAPSDEDLDAMRERLFRLLRISPKLTMVVARDPSLLAGSNLGALYQNGTLVPRDATQAIAWYKLAAEHGCPAAYNALARPYAELGVTNHESEYFWTVVATRAASSEGKTSSPESLTGLRTSISAEDAQRIEAEAEQWMQKHPIALPAFDLFELPEDSVVARVK